MTAKERLLASLLHADRSGATLRIHEALLAMGFKWKERGQTMMYFSKGALAEELGLIAIREGVLSFPRNFWQQRPKVLAEAMNCVSSILRIPLDEKWFSSSQYSAGQLALDSRTEQAILKCLSNVVVPEARKAGAKL